MQTSKTRHSAYDRVAMHVNKRTECVRLDQTHQDDEVPEWYARYEAYFECQKPMEYKVVCGCVIRSTPRPQKSSWGDDYIGKGVVQLQSKKQKLNTRSSAEAKLVGADSIATQILWTKHFMEAQGYRVEENILHQDNKITILLQENGGKSAGKWS